MNQISKNQKQKAFVGQKYIFIADMKPCLNRSYNELSGYFSKLDFVDKTF